MTPKAVMHRYLSRGQDVFVWKLDGLSEYDVRRPLTATGTNLLGVVKHLASVSLGYLGDCFDRPSGVEMPWLADDAEPNADMWATETEGRDFVMDLFQTAREHGDATIEALDLEDTGTVSWWPEELRHPTLATILIHLIAETHRHAGHVDILREQLDGTVGAFPDLDNLSGADDPATALHVKRLEETARRFKSR